MSKKIEKTQADVQVLVNEEVKKPSIVVGKEITIEAETRAEAKAKLSELHSKAKAEGLKATEGGFIQFEQKNYLDPGKFIATITFNK